VPSERLHLLSKVLRADRQFVRIGLQVGHPMIHQDGGAGPEPSGGAQEAGHRPLKDRHPLPPPQPRFTARAEMRTS